MTAESTTNPIPKVLTDQRAFGSFQANFYNCDQSLAKVYGHEDIWGGLIPLGNPTKRQSLIAREVACLKALAPSLDAQVVTVTVPNGEIDTGIVMNEIPRAAFLEQSILSGQVVPPKVFTDIARRVADFHFDSIACPRADVPSMSQYLQELMAAESKMLLEGADIDEQKIYHKWGNLIAKYIDAHTPDLERRRQLLGEPIVGHGDIKSSNMAYLEGDEVCIIDPAPVDMWQINDRRMDAGFFKTELELIGRNDDAQTYWQEYDKAYLEYVAKQGLEPQDMAFIQESNRIIDRISDLYRLTIFHRLAVKKGVNPERGPVSKQLLETLLPLQ